MGVLSYFGLGSNQGDRAANLHGALTLLCKTPRLHAVRASSLWESEPWGVADQPPFLNAVVELRSGLSPPLLLEVAQQIERALGRRREEEPLRWGPRCIDVDLLFYGVSVFKRRGLEVPHPRLQERRFVLEPLCELNSSLLHPVLQRTAAELLAGCEDGGVVRRLEAPR